MHAISTMAPASRSKVTTLARQAVSRAARVAENACRSLKWSRMSHSTFSKMTATAKAEVVANCGMSATTAKLSSSAPNNALQRPNGSTTSVPILAVLYWPTPGVT